MKKIPEADKNDLTESILYNISGKILPGFEPFMTSFLPTELQKRRRKWLEDLAEKISHLEDGMERLSSEEGVTLF
jgi:hypothetical protein